MLIYHGLSSLATAAFFTQSCAAIAGAYPTHLNLLGEKLVVPAFSMPGLPEIRVPTLHSLGSDTGRYPPIIRHVLIQFSNIDKADWVLFNSFYHLVEEVSSALILLLTLNSFTMQQKNKHIGLFFNSHTSLF